MKCEKNYFHSYCSLFLFGFSFFFFSTVSLVGSTEITPRLMFNFFFLLSVKGHDQSSTLAQHSVELMLPNHHPFHRDLLRYAKLMEWLKNTDYGKYDGLTKVRETQPCIILIHQSCHIIFFKI